MLLTKNLQEDVLDYIDPFGSILSSVAWEVRSSYNNNISATPAQAVFGRDMMFNLATLVNWKELSLKKQQLIDKANLTENKKRIDYDYQVGDLVYITKMEFIENSIAQKWDRFQLQMYLQMVQCVFNEMLSTNA